MKDDGGSTGPTAEGMLKKGDDIKFLAVLYLLKLMLPHLFTININEDIPNWRTKLFKNKTSYRKDNS